MIEVYVLTGILVKFCHRLKKSNSSKAYIGIMSRIIYNISDIMIKVRWKRKGLYIVKI